jgi:2-amino-4-hydroxy-6-hydroxymethyldihydropteridine diphosphokinase
MKTEVCISLGSNLGDRAARLAEARRRIASIPGAREVAASSLYETEPVGVDASWSNVLFLNSIVVVETAEDIASFAARLRLIEVEMGRRSGRGLNQPRVIDIDVICAGNEVVATPDLTIPHPRWKTRRFVLEPLAEVRPGLRIPGSDRTVSGILAELPAGPEVRRLESNQWNLSA